jgi:lipopolysaccharide transport system permease protein
MNMVVFGGIAKMSTDGIPQPLFYMAGNVCWFYFSDCLNHTASTFTANQGMFGKVYFPRLVVPIATVLSNLLRFGIQLLLFLAIYLYFVARGTDVTPHWQLVLLPVFIIMIAGLGLGFGIMVSSMTTKYRDLQVLFSFLVQLWMYATPIVYPLSQTSSMRFLGVPVHTFMCLNPVTPIIETFKYGFLGCGAFVGWRWLIYSFVFMLILLTLGLVVFNKVQKSFMDTV